MINVPQLAQAFFEELANINQDFKEAKKMLSKPKQIGLVFHQFGNGPFKSSDVRIKARYLA